MQVRNIILGLITFMALGTPITMSAQRPTRDKEKEKQWKSMETGLGTLLPIGTITSCTTSIPVRKCIGSGQASSPASGFASRKRTPM